MNPLGSPRGELCLPAVPASLDVIHDHLEQLWSHRAGVAEADRWRFETAVAEVAGNIIKHSTPVGDTQGVTLSFAVQADAGSIRGIVVDDGQETDVDLDTVQMPGVQAEDGRGLALAVSLCDVVRYERVGSTNRWTVVCHRIGS